MWDFILNPFITLLTLLYSATGSIVLAIVVFTVLVRLAILPLTMQQMRSAAATQKLQPKLRDLQEKYKNDREKLAQEQMKLYSEFGINPLGGCLPMLVQLPVFLGLYQAIIHALAATPLQLIDISGRLLIPGLAVYIPLNNTWLGMDLTQAPTANPLYALSLPVLVVVTTWLQNRFIMPASQPTTADAKPDPTAATMRSMTTIMPLMFGFFALSFSVGISIYFITGNLIGVAQYALLGNRNKPSAAPATPAANGNAVVQEAPRTREVTPVPNNGANKPMPRAAQRGNPKRNNKPGKRKARA